MSDKRLIAEPGYYRVKGPNIEGYKTLGRTVEGVVILKPKVPPTNFTPGEIRKSYVEVLGASSGKKVGVAKVLGASSGKKVGGAKGVGPSSKK